MGPRSLARCPCVWWLVLATLLVESLGLLLPRLVCECMPGPRRPFEYTPFDPSKVRTPLPTTWALRGPARRRWCSLRTKGHLASISPKNCLPRARHGAMDEHWTPWRCGDGRRGGDVARDWGGCRSWFATSFGEWLRTRQCKARRVAKVSSCLRPERTSCRSAHNGTLRAFAARTPTGASRRPSGH